MKPKAIVAGVSGITGSHLADHLASLGWDVYGIARKPPKDRAGVRPVAADMLDPGSLKQALDGIDPTHVFFTAWLRQPTEAENCRVNGAMIENLLAALDDRRDLRHVALVTGGKNYFGSFDEAGQYDVTTPFREEQPRKPGLNFYYTQEDILFEHARRKGFSWNVHRPTTIIGYAPGNAMNMGTTLAAYATICKETGRPFVFPGSAVTYRCIVDVVDADILARQIAWAATTPEAANRAFNVANGDLFRWDWMWPRIAAYFGLEAAPYPEHPTPLVEQMKDAGPIWDSIVAKHGLKPYKVEDLAPWWHTDADLSRSFEAFHDLSRGRSLGFHDFKESTTAFFDVFNRLRRERIIP
ncbi:SDR family oxidoreductase [Tundrisphaera sp. TA3]|uniref:SDR family oxidoreductase n=1 Tax=Tundrisphaera sp. TA3 TaxID=3435775 RepID=UPI003EBA8C91